MARSVTSHPVFARLYSGIVTGGIRRMGGDVLRGRVLEGLAGTVVEVGAGDGANFPLYPSTVTRIVAVEPEPYLRERAVEAAAADSRITVVDGSAESLPFADGEVDAVVYCLVLCSVADQAVALAEGARVLKPGGQVRFLEHVQAHEPGRMRRVQRALDATVWPLVSGGCHLGRDTVGAIESAGFTVDDVDRFRFPEASRGPESFIVLGTASR